MQRLLPNLQSITLCSGFYAQESLHPPPGIVRHNDQAGPGFVQDTTFRALYVLFHGYAQRSTLKSLIPLIANCPKLGQMSLPVRCIAFDPALLESSIDNINIKTLYYLPATIQCPHKVFRSLVCLFLKPRRIMAEAPDE